MEGLRSAPGPRERCASGTQTRPPVLPAPPPPLGSPISSLLAFALFVPRRCLGALAGKPSQEKERAGRSRCWGWGVGKRGQETRALCWLAEVASSAAGTDEDLVQAPTRSRPLQGCLGSQSGRGEQGGTGAWPQRPYLASPAAPDTCSQNLPREPGSPSPCVPPPRGRPPRPARPRPRPSLPAAVPRARARARAGQTRGALQSSKGAGRRAAAAPRPRGPRPRAPPCGDELPGASSSWRAGCRRLPAGLFLSSESGDAAAGDSRAPAGGPRAQALPPSVGGGRGARAGRCERPASPCAAPQAGWGVHGCARLDAQTDRLTD